jgi:hypothetical protein
VNILGSDQGTKHAPAELATDIELLMDSLAEHDVYQIKGRVFAEGDGSLTPDIITVGIQQLTDSTSNPVKEYNAAFLKLQACRRLRPLVSSWSGAEAETDVTPNALPTPSPLSLPRATTAACDVDAQMCDDSDDSSENGSDGSADLSDPDRELLTAFERTMDEADEPTLT